jgi:hypothetical protein
MQELDAGWAFWGYLWRLETAAFRASRLLRSYAQEKAHSRLFLPQPLTGHDLGFQECHARQIELNCCTMQPSPPSQGLPSGLLIGGGTLGLEHTTQEWWTVALSIPKTSLAALIRSMRSDCSRRIEMRRIRL